VEVPDERSVMTYVAEFFHKFSSEGTSYREMRTDEQIKPRPGLDESKSLPNSCRVYGELIARY